MMEPLAKRNIEIMIGLAKMPKDRPKCAEKIKRYIEMINENKQEYQNHAESCMKERWK